MLSELEIFRQAARYSNENETEKVIDKVNIKILKSVLRKYLIHHSTTSHTYRSPVGPLDPSQTYAGFSPGLNVKQEAGGGGGWRMTIFKNHKNSIKAR